MTAGRAAACRRHRARRPVAGAGPAGPDCRSGRAMEGLRAVDEAKDARTGAGAAETGACATEAEGSAEAPGADAAEEAFALLQRLYDRLPAMEERGALLARAKAAAAAVRLEDELRTARILLDEAEKREAAARAAFERAEEGGDAALADECRRALLHAGSLRGFRVGPARNAEAALARALEEGCFADAAEAHAAVLEPAELASVESEVEAYRCAYAEALARCEALEASCPED